MKIIIARSFIISLILSISAFFALQILFSEIQVPKTSYDSKVASSLTVRELSQYNETHMEKLTGTKVIPYFFDRLFTEIKLGQFADVLQELRTILFLFITIFLGCLWLGAWQKTKT
jgi:hypothetical protein